MERRGNRGILHLLMEMLQESPPTPRIVPHSTLVTLEKEPSVSRTVQCQLSTDRSSSYVQS